MVPVDQAIKPPPFNLQKPGRLTLVAIGLVQRICKYLPLGDIKRNHRGSATVRTADGAGK